MSLVGAKNALSEQAQDERECPFCAELIKAKAVYCKHCRSAVSIKTDGQNEDALPMQGKLKSSAQAQTECASCGNLMRGQAKFCNACGANISELLNEEVVAANDLTDSHIKPKSEQTKTKAFVDEAELETIRNKELEGKTLRTIKSAISFKTLVVVGVVLGLYEFVAFGISKYTADHFIIRQGDICVVAKGSYAFDSIESFNAAVDAVASKDKPGLAQAIHGNTFTFSEGAKVRVLEPVDDKELLEVRVLECDYQPANGGIFYTLKKNLTKSGNQNDPQ